MLSVENLGTNDFDLPAIELLLTNAAISSFLIRSVTLAPGQTASVSGTDDLLNPVLPSVASVEEVPSATTLNWASQELGNRPANIPVDAWNAILDNFVASVGSTVGGLAAALQADAIYLAQVGDPVTSQAGLLAFELEKAEDAAPEPTLTSAVDSSIAETGQPLAFERSFQQPIGYRYQLGSLGFGWTSNWDIAATTDNNGNVFIQQGSLDHGIPS